MRPLDLQVIEQSIDWLEQGQPIWLCTVLSTFGSAPREPGSMLVARQDMSFKGSLSGGCVEEDFLKRLAADEFEQPSQVIRYGAGGFAPTVELPCGGGIDLLIEKLDCTPGNLAELDLVRSALTGGRKIIRRGTVPHPFTTIEHSKTPTPRVARVDSTVSIQIGATQRLVLAGMSPVAEYCAQFATAMGFEVIICDPREGMNLPREIDGATFHKQLPARYIMEGGCHSATAVLALTHDPRLDDLTMMEAIRTDAFYIGVMGSVRTSNKRRDRLKRIAGLNDEELDRIIAPVGLAVGSKTPAHIAIAVMADILRVYNGIDKAHL